MIRMLVSLFVLINVFSVYGQNAIRVDFDYNAFALKDSLGYHLSFDETVNKIAAYSFNDTQKLCLIAGWIYNNIDFDIEKFRTGGVVDDYKTVYTLRKGLCGDYSSIFSAFCTRLNITNEIIEGYVPEYDSDNLVYYATNHAWNVVKLGGNWFHCDLLGFSGNLKRHAPDRLEFIKQPDATNFLTTSLSFLSKKIPADPMWQLLDYPIPLDTFIARGKHVTIDSGVKRIDYKMMINSYLKLNTTEKSLSFARHAYAYNKNNSNAIVANHFNAAIDLINEWNNDKSKLAKAKKYLEISKKHVANATNDVKDLEKQIDEALAMLKKYSLK